MWEYDTGTGILAKIAASRDWYNLRVNDSVTLALGGGYEKSSPVCIAYSCRNHLSRTDAAARHFAWQRIARGLYYWE